MGALGLIGADLPERYGGLGAPSVTAGIATEVVSYADLNVGYVPLLALLIGQIIARRTRTGRPLDPAHGQKMALPYMPERLEILPELPRTPSGKVQKFRFREMARTFAETRTR